MATPNALTDHLLILQFCTNEASDRHILMVITHVPLDIGGGGKEWKWKDKKEIFIILRVFLLEKFGVFFLYKKN